ncbi:NAT, N-acetyltransferase, of N-acetylglutamate synthase [Ceratobasidium sp. AG-Ba]|nr:NAT, N-acetyltransferase, of N-acetylglutamate synthase [Ceratobasidium sp. AG-Ba]QRW08091.1 NAT, N-acetyltransferase, of N-acetylglutamate synthase [Ceratobasidium sp. AG-Ba]
MISQKLVSGLRTKAPALAHTPAASYASVHGVRRHQLPEEDAGDPGANDFILSVLQSVPSQRDAKAYLKSFGPRPTRPQPVPPSQLPDLTLPPLPVPISSTAAPMPTLSATTSPLIASILNPVQRHTALVKFQGPFTDRQLESIARGMVYLEKLGLMSVIVVELEDWVRGEPDERTRVAQETRRVVEALEAQGARARPITDAVVRLGPHPRDESADGSDVIETHTVPSDLVHLRAALRSGEIPVLSPLARDSFLRMVRVEANDVIAGLARGMTEAAQLDAEQQSKQTTSFVGDDLDLTPMRLMIINREGGIPSYARDGLPHLLVNVQSEYDYIRQTYRPEWSTMAPSALSNLRLARSCLAHMPPSSSALVVSHRSPRSLIANLLTNRPAQSSSLPPQALLTGSRRLTRDTPTLIRHGLGMRVLRNVQDIDRDKLTYLMEQSFGKKLDQDAFYARLEKRLDFVIVAGDYAGAAIVTNEGPEGSAAISYLDKFAVLPAHQGDGTVDFLFVALHDESFGLGSAGAANPNEGGRQGEGIGRDLVWRSRADNPVNKWYYERSSGHLRLGKWVLFWSDAEERMRRLEAKAREEAEANGVARTRVPAPSYLVDGEEGRLTKWAEIVTAIPSSWKA